MTHGMMVTALALVLGAPARDGRTPDKRNDARPGVDVEIRSVGSAKYVVEIRSAASGVVVVPAQLSLPPPRATWVSEDLLRVDYGSSLAPDVRSIFYSVRRNEVDGPIGFVVAVDTVREQVLCAGEVLHVQKLFTAPPRKCPVELPDIAPAPLAWFAVSAETRFHGGYLHIVYAQRRASVHDPEVWPTKDLEIACR